MDPKVSKYKRKLCAIYSLSLLSLLCLFLRGQGFSYQRVTKIIQMIKIKNIF